MVGVWEYFFWSCCSARAWVRASKKLRIAAGSARARKIVRSLMKFLFVMMVRLMKPQSRYRGEELPGASFGKRFRIRPGQSEFESFDVGQLSGAHWRKQVGTALE